MNTRIILISFLILFAASFVAADSGHITLLTVASDTDVGGTADLYLTIQPGSGAIFIDSFPLTRIDTQSSVRYANKIACDMLQTDCSKYDFFYTIRANSAIVGGPSAGGAMTVLTVAVLDDQPLDQHMAMTGTINSGGVIGPVAGIGAKVHGAKDAGMRVVLIPSLTTPDDISENPKNSSTASSSDPNATVSMSLRSGIIPELSDPELTVIGVTTVEEALLQFTGKNYSRELKPLAVPDEYTKRMQSIAGDICSRTTLLAQQVAEKKMPYNDSNNYTSRIAALADRDYSRASLCFSKNIELSTLLLLNQSNATRYALYRDLRMQAQELDIDVRNRSLDTISDLEAYAIVKERIIEAQELLDEINKSNPDAPRLAYAQERLVSARSWSSFFGMQGKKLEIDDIYLQRACLAKLSEADERINYVKLYAPSVLLESERLLAQAQGYSKTEPILCIFTASKAKAQADLLANAISVDQKSVDALVGQKLDAAQVVLQKQQEKGFFPILGYSYTQYASDLRTANPYSSLTFAEYAIELSNLDIYFPREKHFSIPQPVLDGFILFSCGVLFGASVIFFVLRRKPEAPKRPTKRVAKRRR